MRPGELLALDTGIVVHLLRGRATGEALEHAYALRTRREKPLISSVTVGELLAFAMQRDWGAKKIDFAR